MVINGVGRTIIPALRVDYMFERYTEKANPATLPEVQHQSPELLAAADPSLGEDRALALLKRADLRAEVLRAQQERQRQEEPKSETGSSSASEYAASCFDSDAQAPVHIRTDASSAYPGGGRRHQENCGRRSFEPPGNYFLRRAPVARSSLFRPGRGGVVGRARAASYSRCTGQPAADRGRRHPYSHACRCPCAAGRICLRTRQVVVAARYPHRFVAQ